MYIIPVLMLLAIACMPVMETGKKQKVVVAMVTIENLKIALACYHDDVGYYPPGDAERDEGNINMVLALCDVSLEEGGKGGPLSPYYEFRDLVPSKYMPSCKVVVDPWDVPYRYVRAADDKGNIKPGMQGKTPFAIWSCGTNMIDEKGMGDDINSWSSSSNYRKGSARQKAVAILVFLIALVIGALLIWRLLRHSHGAKTGKELEEQSK